MIRKYVDATHLAWHKEAVQLSGKVGVIPSAPHWWGRQYNMHAEDSKTYYQHTLTIPFLDQLVMEMNARFLDTQRKLYLGWVLYQKQWIKLEHNSLLNFIVMIYLMQLTLLWNFMQLKWDGHKGEKPNDLKQTLPLADCIFWIIGRFLRSLALYQLRDESVNEVIKHRNV